MPTFQKILWLSGWAFEEDCLRQASLEAGLEEESLFVSSLEFFRGEESEFSNKPSQAALGLKEFLSLHPEVEVVVGWSLGATLALEAITLLEPEERERLKGLLMVAGRAFFPIDQNLSVVPSERAASLIEFREEFDKDPVRQMLRFYRLAGVRGTGLKQRATAILDRYGKGACRSGLLYLEQKDNRRALSRLSLPLVFLSGRLDRVMPETKPESFTSQLMPSEGAFEYRARIELPNAEHNLPETHFREIGLLAKMLAGQPSK